MRPAQADFFFPCRSVMAKSFQISYLQPSFPWVGYIQILICVAICLLCPYKLQDVMFPRGWCLKLKSRPGRERKMLAALHCLMCHRKTVISTDAIWNTNWPQGALALLEFCFMGMWSIGRNSPVETKVSSLRQNSLCSLWLYVDLAQDLHWASVTGPWTVR